MAGLGDLDGDGDAGYLIGARREDASPDTEDMGRAYVFSALFDLRYVLIPPSGSSSFFGGAVAAMPDVDGTGRPGFLVHATLLDAVYLFSSAPGALPALAAEPSAPPS